jgi:hypothetical protein
MYHLGLTPKSYELNSLLGFYYLFISLEIDYGIEGSYNSSCMINESSEKVSAILGSW